ncbi:MAG TPA: DNA topoisomerase IV subunit A [Thermoplasmata archaeon]|nr:DNA topoisomerase IV subunit A [Thermoplasmata archaeon]
MEKVVSELHKIAAKTYDDFTKSRVPSLEFIARTKSNIEFDEFYHVWRYGKQAIERSAKSLGGALMLLRTLYMVDFIKQMLEQKKSSTLRELYYISEGWGKAKFSHQQESNMLAEDLEILTKCMREEFKLRPEENGASVIGNLTVEERTRSGELRKIHCQNDVGDAGYQIPYQVDKDKIKLKSADADFILAIETGGMFDRLVENGFDEKERAILVHLKGQPARSTRRFIKRVNEELSIPVIVFTDSDPWSYRIFASIAYGAIKTAHISQYLATPSSQFLGVTPSDIVNYDLPTDKLTKEDIKALDSELNDPRFKDDFWKEEIKLQLEIGKKSEQQALAKYGLNYVTKTYLPEKLSQMEIV